MKENFSMMIQMKASTDCGSIADKSQIINTELNLSNSATDDSIKPTNV